MRDVLLGILSGVGDAYQTEQNNLLQQEVARRKNLADFWKSQVENENNRPEARDVATQKYLTIAQTPFDKKLPKHVEGLDDFLHIPMKLGESVAAPQEDKVANPATPSPYAPGLLPDIAPPVPPPTLNQETINTWPDATAGPRYTTDEKMAMAQRQMNMASEAAGAKAYAEERGRTKALYTPENVAGMAAVAAAQRPFTIVPRGATVYNAAGEVVGQGQPYERTKEQQTLDAAAKIVAERHGLKIPDPMGIGVFGKLPPSLQLEAAREQAMMTENPDIAEIRKLTKARDQQLLVETNLRIKQLMAENDPEAYGKIAELVKDNPDALFNYSPSEVKKISDAMLKAGYPVPRKPLPAALATQAGNADLTLQSIDRIRAIIAKYPDSVGPMMGRAGLTEEEWGAPIFSVDRSPEQASAEQELRTSMKYLIAQDLKALIGSRPPQNWMTELKNSSANPRMALTFLNGSLNGMAGNAKAVLDLAYRTRYGTQPTATGRGPGSTPPPAPPPGASNTAPSTPKMITTKDVQDFAIMNSITVGEARKQLEDAARAQGQTLTILPALQMRRTGPR